MHTALKFLEISKKTEAPSLPPINPLFVNNTHPATFKSIILQQDIPILTRATSLNCLQSCISSVCRCTRLDVTLKFTMEEHPPSEREVRD